MDFLKVVDDVGYGCVLNPMHHSKKAFMLGNSNKMKFPHREQHERQPPMQELKARILDIKPKISLQKSRRLNFLMAWYLGKQFLEKSMSSVNGENQTDMFPQTSKK
jgi:hypothetical protein